MKAPLIAVISVGIAAAAPAVAVSAVSADQSAPAPQVGTGVQQTDLQRPIGPVTVNQKTKEEIEHTKLLRRYLRLRKRANRLIAHRHHRKQRVADTAVQ